jgi:hypothetical protein
VSISSERKAIKKKQSHIPEPFIFSLFKVQAQVLVVDNASRQVIHSRSLGKFNVGLGFTSFLGPVFLVRAFHPQLCVQENVATSREV